MPVELDLADIQGNILTGYGRVGFPKGRIMLFHIDNGDSGRKFVTKLLPLITTALRWPSSHGIPTGKRCVSKPEVTVNIAITFESLAVLGVGTRTLRGMPDEFMDGMAKRAPMLGDDFAGPNWKNSWDEVWKTGSQDGGMDKDRVHIMISLFAWMKKDGSPVAALDEKTREIEGFCRELGGIRLLPGHNQKGHREQPYQELSALFDYDETGGSPTPNYKEHFGFDDGLGDPVFDGQYPNRYEQNFKEGNGALDANGHWRPLATGEFLLGYPDESQEIAPAAMSHAFSRNGTFLVYRKLQQNVSAFRKFLDDTTRRFGVVFRMSEAHARITLMAKMAGRWPDGVPLSVAPTVAHWKHFNSEYPEADQNARYLAQIKFAFRDDPEGTKCPLGAHIRRANTRDMLDPLGGSASTINNRRRILRRGVPYGESPRGVSDQAEHGVGMFIYCASLFRQFEFVQQQWINFGFPSRSGNDTCPIIGIHSQGVPGSGQGPKAKFVIPADPSSGHPPFIADGIPQFVETRGGEYFFVPSMTALRMIGMRAVDPT